MLGSCLSLYVGSTECSDYISIVVLWWICCDEMLIEGKKWRYVSSLCLAFALISSLCPSSNLQIIAESCVLAEGTLLHWYTLIRLITGWQTRNSYKNVICVCDWCQYAQQVISYCYVRKSVVLTVGSYDRNSLNFLFVCFYCLHLKNIPVFP